ncbi:MAG TPA: type II toxin-antitoxin system MqsA family antitoxin [Caldilineae bacterium]|nr:type II toxin-antitoxin system MqsA family antitoxin [Caldilineae bacterium]
MAIEPGRDKLCPLCGGRLQEKTATLPFVVKGTVVIVKGALAEVCEDCGEAFLTGKATDEVVALLQDAVSRGVELTVVTLPQVPSPV